MSDCRRIAERLTPYVDGLLPPEERRGIDQHLAACPPCRHHADRERGGRDLLRDCASRLLAEPVPPELRTRCEALAAARRRSAAPAAAESWWRARLVPVALSAVVMIFMASAVLSIATPRSDTLLAAQLTADHAKCFRLFARADGPPADADEVERELAERYGWKVHVPPSLPGGEVQLVGARRCLYGEGTIPHVMYRIGGSEVSLFVLDGQSRAPADLVTLGHRSRIWPGEGKTFVLVAPAGSAGEMGDGARYVMREAR